MYPSTRRVQRREFKDYPPVFMLLSNLDIIDDATRRDFACLIGQVWQRYNAATKGAKERRITALFLSNERNTFDELLFVGCDFVTRRQHHCLPLWSEHPLASGWSAAQMRIACIERAGRSVLHWRDLALDSGAGGLEFEAAPPAIAMPTDAAQ